MEACEALLSFGSWWIAIYEGSLFRRLAGFGGGRHLSLEGSLLMITSHLRPQFIHLLLKVRNHLDELILGSIVPCPRGSRRERQSFPNILDVDIENSKMLIIRPWAYQGGWLGFWGCCGYGVKVCLLDGVIATSERLFEEGKWFRIGRTLSVDSELSMKALKYSGKFLGEFIYTQIVN